MKIWSWLHRAGGLGDIVIVAFMLMCLPTIVVWVFVIDGVCEIRDYLSAKMDSGAKELARRVSIGMVVIICVPILIFNAMLIASLTARVMGYLF